MMTNNAITIPTGLVVDAEQINTSGTTNTITAAETYATAAHRSNLVVSGGVSEPMLTAASGSANRQFAIDFSLDGTNWTQFYLTNSLTNNFGTGNAGHIFNNVQFIGHNILNVPASSTVHFRARRIGSITSTFSWGFGILIIEERNVDMTT